MAHSWKPLRKDIRERSECVTDEHVHDSLPYRPCVTTSGWNYRRVLGLINTKNTFDKEMIPLKYMSLYKSKGKLIAVL